MEIEQMSMEKKSEIDESNETNEINETIQIIDITLSDSDSLSVTENGLLETDITKEILVSENRLLETNEIDTIKEVLVSDFDYVVSDFDYVSTKKNTILETIEIKENITIAPEISETKENVISEINEIKENITIASEINETKENILPEINKNSIKSNTKILFIDHQHINEKPKIEILRELLEEKKYVKDLVNMINDHKTSYTFNAYARENVCAYRKTNIDDKDKHKILKVIKFCDLGIIIETTYAFVLGWDTCPIEIAWIGDYTNINKNITKWVTKNKSFSMNIYVGAHKYQNKHVIYAASRMCTKEQTCRIL